MRHREVAPRVRRGPGKCPHPASSWCAYSAACAGPLTDLIARHDVEAFTGSQRAVHLQAALETARTQLLALGAGVFTAGALVFIADSMCSATTIRARRDEWIKAGIFAWLKQIALDAYDRFAVRILQELAVDGCIAKAPGGRECAGRSPVDRGKQGMKRSSMAGGYGIPLNRVPAGANRHDSPLLAVTLDKLDDLGPLPDGIQVHLDAGCDWQRPAMSSPAGE
jgi:hypothetical protein